MFTMNTFLELGASVLILWYGGMMVMDEKDKMTMGNLITYQLYWNMLNNSYKSLLDIVTSFTRGAGASQKVFSIIDSIPDIDANIGIRVNPCDIIGHLSIKSVSFAYQMRPDRNALQDISFDIPAGSTCALVGKSGGKL